jgi:tetratricopeptide (TPR) repeat protein
MGVVDYRPPLTDGPFRVANILRDHADRCALEKMQENTIRQSYSRMRKQNPHEILGVTPSASRSAIERAYAEAKSLFARDRIVPRVRERFRTELGVIESRLVEAYLQLTKPERASTRKAPAPEAPVGGEVRGDDLLMRPELDKTRTRSEADEAARVAEMYYSKARKAMMSGDFHNAIQYGKLAISYNAEDARIYFMLAECQVRNPEARWQRMAEQNYCKATQLDPWNAEYWMSLGRFYKKRGLGLRARRQFEEALKLVPEHEEATRELEALR